MRHLVAYFLSALLWLSAAQAQTAPASLIADAISVDASQRLTASGNVEVLYQDYVLKATRIIYDPTTDLLTIEGPLSIVTGDGTFLLASSAEVSPDLANGLLRTARLILDRQLQLAASNLHRIDGRYTVLDQTVATSCTVCGTEVPLWQIRAARVIHDQQERQLYFTDARFEVAGVPLMYLPRLRLPDPTLERATGFLVPDIRVSEQLGVGLQVPYFVTLGPHADLTFGPYISSRTRTLDVRFRRAFAHGEIELNGAVSDDALRSGVRAYLFAEGQFDLPRDFVLDFDLKSVSDSAYLLDYGISSSDRLASPVSISRTRHDERIVARATVFESLREGEDARLQPRTLLEAATIRRFSPGFAGGIATLQADFLAFDRPSEQDVLGRDLERASFSADWQRNWLSQWGLVFETQLAARGDLYSIQNDSTSPETTFRTAQFAAAELRWPLLRRTQSGATQVLEPVLQLVWSGADNDNIPNEDSLITEFDEGNLFSLSRFPGVDAIEQGLRANIGVNWSHHSPGGWQWHTTAGRILRANKTGQFDDATGLNGAASN